jgi:hypothetical protein
MQDSNFQKYLSSIINDPRSIKDNIYRCRRIEKILNINLDTYLKSKEKYQTIRSKILDNKTFTIKNSSASGKYNLVTSLTHYLNFINTL